MIACKSRRKTERKGNCSWSWETHGKPLHVANLYNTLKQRWIVAVFWCEKRRRRTCVTGEGAENGLQRTVKLSTRSKAIKQNLCFSIYVSAFVIQHLCFSIYVSGFVIQQLCFSFCVPASVFHKQSRLPSMTTLTICVIFCFSHISNKFMVPRFGTVLGFLAILFWVYGYCIWVRGHINLPWALIFGRWNLLWAWFFCWGMYLLHRGIFAIPWAFFFLLWAFHWWAFHFILLLSFISKILSYCGNLLAIHFFGFSVFGYGEHFFYGRFYNLSRAVYIAGAFWWLWEV